MHIAHGKFEGQPDAFYTRGMNQALSSASGIGALAATEAGCNCRGAGWLGLAALRSVASPFKLAEGAITRTSEILCSASAVPCESWVIKESVLLMLLSMLAVIAKIGTATPPKSNHRTPTCALAQIATWYATRRIMYSTKRTRSRPVVLITSLPRATRRQEI
eukprot:4923730-Pleurochrysis_carterae.AAC.12